MARDDARVKVDRDIRSILAAGLATPDVWIWAVEEDGRRVGTVFLGRRGGDLWLYDITIDADERGKGYGRGAMLALEEEVRSSRPRVGDAERLGRQCGRARSLSLTRLRRGVRAHAQAALAVERDHGRCGGVERVRRSLHRERRAARPRAGTARGTPAAPPGAPPPGAGARSRLARYRGRAALRAKAGRTSATRASRPHRRRARRSDRRAWSRTGAECGTCVPTGAPGTSSTSNPPLRSRWAGEPRTARTTGFASRRRRSGAIRVPRYIAPSSRERRYHAARP